MSNNKYVFMTSHHFHLFHVNDCIIDFFFEELCENESFCNDALRGSIVAAADDK